MKVVHFSTSDNIGAFRASYLLHQALKNAGIESVMLVKNKTTADPSVFQIGQPTIKEFIVKKTAQYRPLHQIAKQTYRSFRQIFPVKKVILNFNQNQTSISLGLLKPYLKNADIVCLHWLDGFLSTNLIKEISQFTQAPIVWTLLDIEPLTGGCHYTYGCTKFKKSCGQCPQLKSTKKNDLSRIIWQQKEKTLRNLNITFIAPSAWVDSHIKDSSLFNNRSKVEKILLSVDTDIFKKAPQEQVRIKLQLPLNKKIIFLGARSLKDKRKGTLYLLKSLNILYEKLSKAKSPLINKILLITAGEDSSILKTSFQHRHLGFLLNIKKLASAYQAADIFACPSIEDAGPMMINEALMCGTPVVAFNTGVAPDLITSEDRGYIAQKYNVEDFSQGIYNLLTVAKTMTRTSLPTECTPRFQAKRYLDVFCEILKTKNF